MHLQVSGFINLVSARYDFCRTQETRKLPLYDQSIRLLYKLLILRGVERLGLSVTGPTEPSRTRRTQRKRTHTRGEHLNSTLTLEELRVYGLQTQ